MHSPYNDKDHVKTAVAEGKHREVIGGLWDELGELQLNWLIRRGMQPSDYLLDVGCGSLRLGTRAVNYLEASHYFGTDISIELLDVGYEKEIADKAKLPRENLSVEEDFSFSSVTERTTHAIATSVFTHLPFNHLRRALLNLKRRFSNLEEFSFTVFLAPDVQSTTTPVEQKGGVWTHDIKDPYHYLPADIAYLCSQTGFDFEICDFSHPRNQKMVVTKPER